MEAIEYKNLGFSEVKTTSDMIFEGYGAVFNNTDYQGDMIMSGAFSETLSQAKGSGIWPPMLLQHGGYGSDDKMPVGIWTALSEDSKGLRVTGQLADTQKGRDVYALLKMPRPAITGLSIGYHVESSENGTRFEEPRRKLLKLDLREISLVTFPANDKARIDSVKSDLSPRLAESVLIDAGFSRKQARMILSGGYKSARLCDADGELEEMAMHLCDAGDGQNDTAKELRRLIAAIKPSGGAHA